MTVNLVTRFYEPFKNLESYIQQTNEWKGGTKDGVRIWFLLG